MLNKFKSNKLKIEKTYNDILYKYSKINNNNLLFIDTETNGLPLQKGYENYYSYKELDKYDSSRIIKVVWSIYTPFGVKIKEQIHIVKVNFKIENTEFHDITNDISEKKGIELKIILDYLMEDLKISKFIIGHNIDFDMNILFSELYRLKNYNLMRAIRKKTICCLGDETTKLLDIKNKGGFLKMPKLDELYEYCFKINKEKFNIYDIVKIFFYLQKKHKLFDLTKS